MDAALSRGLLDELACTYHLSFATVRCPWIFDSRGSLEKYIVTFWFEGARGNDEQVRRILADASRVNGLPTSWSVAGFGWNLGFAVLERRNSGVGGVARAAVRRVVALLGILLGITFVNLCLKCLTYHSGLYDALDQIIIVVLAVASGEVVAEWRRRVEMRETHVLNDPMPQQPSTSPPLSSLSD